MIGIYYLSGNSYSPNISYFSFSSGSNDFSYSNAGTFPKRLPLCDSHHTNDKSYSSDKSDKMYSHDSSASSDSTDSSL